MDSKHPTHLAKAHSLQTQLSYNPLREGLRGLSEGQLPMKREERELYEQVKFLSVGDNQDRLFTGKERCGKSRTTFLLGFKRGRPLLRNLSLTDHVDISR